MHTTSPHIDRSARLQLVLEECRADSGGPALVFDLAQARAIIAAARAVAEDHRCELLFAVKSLPAPRVLALFAAAGIGFDVSNGNELALVRDTLTKRELQASVVSMTGPAPGSLAALGLDSERWAREVMFNVETPDQLSLLPVPIPPALAVGARLGVSLAVDRGRPSARRGTRFGVDPEDSASVAQIAAHPAFSGIHCHVDHELNDAWVYGELAARAATITAALGARISYVNLGGGPDRGSGVDGLTDALCAIRAHLPDIRLLLEPGGWWTAGCGFAVGRVLSVKRALDGRSSHVVLDLSAECHLRWTQPRLTVPQTASGEGDRETVHFCGPTCFEDDVIGVFEVPVETAREHLRVGCTVLFENVSGYAAAWNSGFNGIPPARVVLLE